MSHDSYCNLSINPDLSSAMCACALIREVRLDERQHLADYFFGLAKKAASAPTELPSSVDVGIVATLIGNETAEYLRWAGRIIKSMVEERK